MAFVPALCLVMSLALSGCAKPGLKGYDSAFQTFEAFKHAYLNGGAPGTGLATQSSLIYQAGKKRVRIIMDFWGDFSKDGHPGKLRMDAWSSVGGSLAFLLEDAQGLVAYYPDQAVVYTHSDPVAGARLLGLPFPFSLADLADVLFGRFTNLVPDRYYQARAGTGGTFIYTFAEGDVERLVLDAQGRPLSLDGRLPEIQDQPWPASENVFHIDFLNYYEPDPGPDGVQGATGPALPDRIEVTLPGERSGILRVKFREAREQPWAEDKVSLVVPMGVVWQLLDREARDWTTGAVITVDPAAEESGATE